MSGAEPEIAFPISQNPEHGFVGEPILFRKCLEIAGLAIKAI